MNTIKPSSMCILSIVACAGLLDPAHADAFISETAKSHDSLDISIFGEPASADILSSQTGRQSVDIAQIQAQISDATLNGELSGNVLENATSGNNIVTDYAFSQVTGIPTLIQNSGNQVLIQNSIIMNFAWE